MSGLGTYGDPDLLDRSDLDLSRLRRHCREMHREAPRRSNLDLASWHVRMHHQYYTGHRHEGPYTLVRDRRGRRPAGVTPVPLGTYTGQDAVTREQDHAAFQARVRRGGE